MPTIFTKIINGEIPCHKIAEDDQYFAFLDINPNAIGHTLCVPKKEVNKIFELDEETYAGLMAFSRKVGLGLERAIPCDRVGIAVVGLEVPHVHVHLIPINQMADMTFQKKVQMTSEELAATATKIREQLS